MSQLEFDETGPTLHAQFHGHDIVPAAEHRRPRRKSRVSCPHVLDDGVTTDHPFSSFTEDSLGGIEQP
jgi:hypothetical protein